MLRSEFGKEKQYCVRFDAYETKVDVQGCLTMGELNELIAALEMAKKERMKQRCEPGQCDPEPGQEGADYSSCRTCGCSIDLRG